MYTQCPDCGTSFRVTAVVLKQAAGKVRCGGCGNAFNALAYLSEAKPDPSVRTEADGSLPELTPDTIATSSNAPPTAISPEQSAALLKTLDQLAGEDIRLEDTGIEWRVMSDDEESIDELLDPTPTEVDEFLTKTPTEVEAGEIFDDPKPSQVESVEVFEGADERPTQTSAEELRFDDNTGLPDDFDFDDIPVAPPKLEPEPEPDSDSDPDPDREGSQVDLVFGDAADWGDLLDEVEPEPEPEPVPEPEPEPEPEDGPEPKPEPENEFGEELDERIAAEELEASANQPPDIDTQFGLQAEAMGIDLSGMHETVEEEPAEDDANFPDSTGALEFELKKAQSAAEQLEADLEDFAEEQATQDEEEHTPEEVDEDETPEEIEIDLVEDLDTEEPIADINKFDEKIESLEIRLDDEIDDEVDHEHVVPPTTEAEQTVNMQIDQDLFDLAIKDEDGFASTIVIENKKKIEDEILEESSPRHAKNREREAAAVEKLKDTGSGFETIIMEGEAIRSAMEQEALDADEATGTESKPKFVLPQEVIEEEPSHNKKYGMIAGAVVLVILLAAQIVHQSRAEIAQVPALNNVIAPLYRAIGAPITPSWDVSGWRVEVTKGSTNPIAEFVDGNPVVADADVEMIDDTAGIIGGEDETLTIYSRIGNTSEKPLPYPLISISLLDRFDSVIGNQVLEPNRYLTGDFDPRVPVSPGDTFNAVISIESPSADAAGFKVQVCYRQSAELLRCAIQAYK